jgi:predicted transcriptional regulator
MKAKTIMVNMYLTPTQKRALDKVTEQTRIPRAVLVREAIDDLLKKYSKK